MAGRSINRERRSALVCRPRPRRNPRKSGSPSPGPARSASARSTAPSVAAPKGWSPPAACPRPNTSACAAPFMGGAFPFPVKYGYAMVGRVESGTGRTRRIASSLRCIRIRASSTCPPEAAVRPTRRPAARPRRARRQYGDRAQRDVGRRAGRRRQYRGRRRRRRRRAGRLAVRPASRRAGDACRRRAFARRTLPARSASASPRPTRRRRIAISSFTPAAPPRASRPRSASRATKRRCSELSWHGAGDVAVPLGGAFHSRRLKLISSQVGRVAPSHRPRWTPSPTACRRARPARGSAARCADRAGDRISRTAAAAAGYS